MTDALDDCLDVPQALCSLLPNIASDDIVRSRIDGQLSRNVIVVRKRDSLGVKSPL
jgi:hypothetical protein